MDLTKLVDVGSAGVIAVSLIVVVRAFLQFLREERAQRNRIMDQATKALTSLTERIAVLEEYHENRKNRSYPSSRTSHS